MHIRFIDSVDEMCDIGTRKSNEDNIYVLNGVKYKLICCSSSNVGIFQYSIWKDPNDFAVFC
jgi:hypothetical protein